ncbi:MAG: hypothetical protein RI897_820 [Verrucomicrobiota bacterium]
MVHEELFLRFPDGVGLVLVLEQELAGGGAVEAGLEVGGDEVIEDGIGDERLWGGGVESERLEVVGIGLSEEDAGLRVEGPGDVMGIALDIADGARDRVVEGSEYDVSGEVGEEDGFKDGLIMWMVEPSFCDGGFRQDSDDEVSEGGDCGDEWVAVEGRGQVGGEEVVGDEEIEDFCGDTGEDGPEVCEQCQAGERAEGSFPAAAEDPGFGSDLEEE